MVEFDAVVLGAGAAGLAASWKLARAGQKVAVLEARERAGGRAYTFAGPTALAPYELGAEFVHGARNEVTELCREAALRLTETRDRHWDFANGKLRSADGLWEKMDEALQCARQGRRDQTFDEFLGRLGLDEAQQERLRLFVEGFDAADTRRISTQSLVKAQENDDQSFRIQGGYIRLMDWLRAGAENGGAEFHYSTAAQTVGWRPGAVEVVARTATGRQIFRGRRAIITLPLGVLKAGAVRFAPRLRKRGALEGLEMGGVVKVTLSFGERFWNKRMRDDFGFIHGPTLTFPTWWSRPRAPLLTGWVGGPRAESIDKRDLLTTALRDLRRVFGIPIGELRGQLREWRWHDWQADPYSRGAYSYTVAGHVDAPEKLAEPVAKTLLISGEATTSGAAQGTVHGALRSGMRAAERLLEDVMTTWPRRARRPFSLR